MGSGTAHNTTTKQQPGPVGEHPIIWWWPDWSRAWCWQDLAGNKKFTTQDGREDRGGFILFYNYLSCSVQADSLCILHLSLYLFKLWEIWYESWAIWFWGPSNTPQILSDIFWSVRPVNGEQMIYNELFSVQTNLVLIHFNSDNLWSVKCNKWNSFLYLTLKLNISIERSGEFSCG